MRRRLAEALTITLGILAAFAVDAWWDEVQEARSDRANLEKDFLGARGGAHAMASAYRSSVSGEVVGERRSDLPGSRHTLDWDVLIVDPAFESELVFLLLFAQFSQEEAVVFRDTLVGAISRLELVLGDAVV